MRKFIFLLTVVTASIFAGQAAAGPVPRAEHWQAQRIIHVTTTPQTFTEHTPKVAVFITAINAVGKLHENWISTCAESFDSVRYGVHIYVELIHCGVGNSPIKVVYFTTKQPSNVTLQFHN